MQQDYYDGLPDSELISLSRDHDDCATETLISRYKNLVRLRARSMFILGGDSEDLIQEGMIGLFKAVRDYDCGRDASFSTFAALCISRQLYTAVQASGRKKHMPLNTAVSLSSIVGTRSSDGTEGKGVTELGDTVPGGSSVSFAGGYGADPQEILIDRENLEQLEEKIESELSAFEKQVLDLHLTGMNYIEIAHILNRDEKSTDNAMQRIRSKVRRLVEK